METNHEHGTGRPDIVAADEVNRRALIIEAKHSKSREAMEADCRGALKHIDFCKYAEEFLDGYTEVICYGIAYYRKQCLVRKK